MPEKIKEIILLIEDDAGIAELVCEKLGENGRNVAHVKSGKEARVWLEQNHPQLILLDYSLPDMTGAEFVKQVIDMPPFIVTTGAGDEEIAVTMMKRGARDYLIKDIRFLDNLPLIVEQVLREVAIERQLAESEKSLKESVEQRRILLQTAMDGFWMADMQGCLVEVNEVYCRMSGYNKSELLTMHISDLESSETADNTIAHMQKIMDQGEDRFETRHRRKDGSIFDVEISVQYRDVEGGRFVVFLRDITERKQAEESLQASNERFRSLFEDSPISIWEEDFSAVKTQFDILRQTGITDFKTYWKEHPQELGKLAGLIQIVDINQAGVEMLGAENKEQIRKNLLDYFTEESMKIFEDEIIALAEGQTQFKGEIPIQNLRGEHAILELILNVQPGCEETLERVLVSFLDITERKHAEEALYRREQEFKTLVENSPDAITRFDMKGRYQYVNPARARYFGLDPHAIIGKTWWDLLSPEEEDEGRIADEAFRKILEEPTEYSIEYQAHTPQGIRWVHSRGVREFAKDGTVESVLVITHDITERKQAEEALRESEERFRAIFEQAAVGVALLETKTGRYVRINQTYCNFLGYTPEEMLQIGFQNVTHPEDVQANADHNALFISGQIRTFSLEKRYVRRDGKLVWGKLTASALWSPGEIPDTYFHIAVVEDITERKQAEEALRESEERLRDITFSMADWVWEVDEKGVYTYSSQKGIELLGLSHEDIIGKTPFDFMTPDEAKRIAVIFSELAANKSPIKDLENWNIRKNGERLCMLTNAVPILDKEGNFKGYRGVDKDITERKKVEDALLFLLQSGYSDEDFFLSLARYLSNSLDMDYVCIDRLLGDQLSAQTVAIYFDGKFEDNVAYALKDTPCSNVVGNTICVFPSQVRQLFPKDIVLQEMLAESYIGTTLWNLHGQPIGLIAIIGRKPLDPAHRSTAEAVLKLVAVRAAGELERKQAADELLITQKALEAANNKLQIALDREKELARTDVLTGVNNRRQLFEIAEREFEIATRYKKPLSVIMFDIDHFKEVNDTFGHAVGDQILKYVTQAACAELRSTDVIGRYGGEEFVIMLPMTDAQNAHSLAERIREEVAAIRMPTEKGDASVTLSIGIAEIIHSAQTGSAEDLIRRADEAMYAAKNAGRNRTEIGE